MQYASYIVLQVMIPFSVSLSTVYVGWFMHFEEQAKLVGRKGKMEVWKKACPIFFQSAFCVYEDIILMLMWCVY